MDNKNNNQLNTEKHILEIAEWILNNYKSIKDIEDILAKTYLSEKYFITVFKKYTLETPHAILNKLKLLEAKKLLETTELPITEIAKKCGFTSANTFTKLFKSKFDVNPKLYRQCKI